MAALQRATREATMRARAFAGGCKDENVAAACESEERPEVHIHSQFVNGYDEVD